MARREIRTMYLKNNRYNNVHISEQAFTGLPAQASGDRAIRMGLEHDPSYLPLGKIAEIKVEDKDDHTLITTIVDDTHAVRRFQHLRTGTLMIEMTFANDSRPFVHHPVEGRASTIVAKADLANFDNTERFEAFVAQSESQPSHAGPC